jgi:hypothetical protein
MYERGSSNGRVFTARRIEQKRRLADCGVGVSLIEGERSGAKPVLKLPMVTENSEYQATPVFAEPVVRLLRAFVPSALVNPG